MSTRTNLITGIAIGSGMMFLLDPQQGNRRRALVRDSAGKWSRSTGDAIERTGHVLEAAYRRTATRTRSVADAVRRMRYGSDQVPDGVLEARLRSCIGRHSTHPRAIAIQVREACAMLSGPVLASEVREVLECASAVRGLRAVDNQLEVHAEAGNIPALQGSGHRRSMFRWWERSPALRVAAGAAAAAMVAYAAGRRAFS